MKRHQLLRILGLFVICVVLGGWLSRSSEIQTESALEPSFHPGLNMPPAIESIVRRSCADCHSEATHWPWYAKLPPASFLVHRDVEQAREAMNFSRWAELSPGVAKGMLAAACAEAELGRMPMGKYLLLHPGARMSASDVQALCAWTRAEGEELRSNARTQATHPNNQEPQ